MSRPAQTSSPTADRTGDRLRAYAAAELARAIACLGWRGGRVHDGVHQARKSLRRLRATLALGMPDLGPGALLIDRAVQRTNRGLSKLRDAQALVHTLDVLLEHEDPAASAVLRRARRIAAQMRVKEARATLTDDPQLRDRRALLATLQAALPALRWNDISATEVAARFRRSLARLEEAGAHARASGRDEDWHRWRRRTRRFSQQHRALGESTALPAEVERRHKELATLLGEAQDYALLREHCGKRSAFAEDDRRVLRSLSKRGTRHLRRKIAQQAVEASAAAHGPTAAPGRRADAPT